MPTRPTPGLRASIALPLALCWSCGLIEHRPNDEAGAAAGAEAAEASPNPAADAKLATLGYLGATEVSERDRTKRDVVRHDPERSQIDLISWTSNGWGGGFMDVPGQVPRRDAVLIDASGTELHRWRAPDRPGDDFVRGPKLAPKSSPEGWDHVVFDDEGMLYAVDLNFGIMKVDWDSKMLWDHKGRFHHDLDIGVDGNVWALSSEEMEVEFRGEKIWVWNDIVSVLSAETGELVREYPLYEPLSKLETFDAMLGKVVERRSSKGRARSDLDAMAKHRSHDAFHINTVDVLERPLEGVWEVGDVLVCFRHIDLVAVLDKDDGSIKWAWENSPLDHPHDPSFLDDDTILIFDNRPNTTRKSRIVQFDPRTTEIQWTYSGSADEPFYSASRGQVYRLDGGNTLIIESQRGRMFEVTPAGDIVWEWFSPDTFVRQRKGKKGRGKGATPKGPKLLRVPFRAGVVPAAAAAVFRARLAGDGDAPPAEAGPPNEGTP